MQERHIDRESYFEEQARTTEKYYIPYICNAIGNIPHSVLEVGCGEGGNLLPFARLGCEVVGVDMAAKRIEQARNFFKAKKQKGIFIASDIFKLKEFRHNFSLIIVHDVIEHIDNKEAFLLNLRQFLIPNGCIFIAFPAWQMPFGGHQQIAKSKIVSHTPFIHLLPAFLYKALLNVFDEKENTIRELLSIKKTKCSIELFLDTVHKTHYQITSKQLYFINPHYEVKFGFASRKLNKAIAHIPYLRNFFCTSCFYILRINKSLL